ncbi:hypothetical protein FSP39_017006 [Pinctada imbricata]|uniref:Uncharacterized protein n=1 Tax=Pinctada imbricata TaxID=66713 RepID=A0AA89CBY5_PINIB|nr:hypothetical protein FSP39_017006 [Pinctada imbricata]
MATSTDSQIDLTTCSICLETFKTPKNFPCLHSFCEGCLQTYITTSFGQTKGGVNCPVCRMFVSKPDDISIEEWAKNLPTNYILVSLIDLNETKSGQKLCAECARENESENACSWCVNCAEALCKSCYRSHRRNKTSSDHKLVELDKGLDRDIPLYHADVFCSEHTEEKVKVYCEDHSAICCMTCVMLNHRKCDHVRSIEDAASKLKKSKQTEEFSQNLQDLKICLTRLCKNRTISLQTLDLDLKQIRDDIDSLFKGLSCHLTKMKRNIMSEISDVEKEITSEIENEHFEIKCKIPAVENDLSLFQTSMKHAPPAQFIQAMEKLEEQKKLLENFVRDQSKTLRDIRVTFKANEKLMEISKIIQEFGEVNITRNTNYELQHSINRKLKIMTSMPTLTSKVDTGFHVTGIAFLENGQVVLSNHNSKKIELLEPRSSTILSSLSLPSFPWGIKIMRATEGSVAVEGKGLTFFNIQRDRILKVTEMKTEVNRDFVHHRGQFYIGCNRKIIVYDKLLRKVREITVNCDVGYMAVRDENTMCFTCESRGRELCCITMDGIPVFTYSQDKLQGTRGVTVDHTGYIYACGLNSRNVHQLSHNGKLQRIVYDNLPTGPYCIHFNTQGDKAVIGCEGKILLYDLE